MTWYGWLIGGYYGIPALVSFFVVIIVIRDEIDRNLLSRSPLYRSFIKDCWAYVVGGIVFCLVFLPLVIEPYLKKRGVRVMGRSWQILKKAEGISLVLVIALLIGVFTLLIEFQDLTWHWTRWHPWIIVFWFFWIYFAIGIRLGIYLDGGYWWKCKREKKYFSLLGNSFEVVLVAVGWFAFFPLLIRDLYREKG